MGYLKKRKTLFRSLAAAVALWFAFAPSPTAEQQALQAAGSKDGPRGKLDDPMARPSCAAFSADGKLVAVGFINTFPQTKRATSGRVIKMWDVKTRKELKTFAGHEGGVSFVAFFPDGKKAISSGGDGLFRVWDVATGAELWNAQGEGSLKALTEDGKRAFSWGRKIVQWSVEKKGFVKVHEYELLPQGGGPKITVSPNGNMAIFDGWGSRVQLWDVNKHQLLREYERTNLKGIFPLAFSPKKNLGFQGKRAGKEVLFSVVDFTNNKVFCSFDQEAASWLWNTVFSPDGRRLFYRVREGEVVALDVEGGKQLWSIQDRQLKAEVFAFSPDTKLAISADGRRSGAIGDLRLILWDTVKGKIIGDLSEPLFPY